jgi:hypothetical protein
MGHGIYGVVLLKMLLHWNLVGGDGGSGLGGEGDGGSGGTGGLGGGGVGGTIGGDGGGSGLGQAAPPTTYSSVPAHGLFGMQ